MKYKILETLSQEEYDKVPAISREQLQLALKLGQQDYLRVMLAPRGKHARR